MSTPASTTTAPTVEVVDPDYPVTPVPRHARKSFVSLAVVLLGFTVFTPTMLAGAQLGAAFSLSELVQVILLGSLVLGVYVAVLGFIGARTGLTTVVMSRYVLGQRGAKLASLLLGGTQIGWYGVVIGTIGDLTAQALEWESYPSRAAVMVVASALMCLTACYGYRGMFWVSAISTPLILVLAFWVLLRSLEEVGGWSGLAEVQPDATMTWSVAEYQYSGPNSASGTSATFTASKPNSAARRFTTGSRSTKRLVAWKTITPSGLRCFTYSAIASRVTRCMGIESPEKASMPSTS